MSLDSTDEVLLVIEFLSTDIGGGGGKDVGPGIIFHVSSAST